MNYIEYPSGYCYLNLFDAADLRRNEIASILGRYPKVSNVALFLYFEHDLQKLIPDVIFDGCILHVTTDYDTTVERFFCTYFTSNTIIGGDGYCYKIWLRDAGLSYDQCAIITGELGRYPTLLSVLASIGGFINSGLYIHEPVYVTPQLLHIDTESSMVHFYDYIIRNHARLRVNPFVGAIVLPSGDVTKLVEEIVVGKGLDANTIFRGVVNTHMNNPNSEMCKTYVEGLLGRAVDHTKHSHKGPTLNIYEKLNEADKNKLEESFPELTLKFLDKINHGHPFAKASRRCETELILNLLKVNMPQQNVTSEGYDVVLKDIGGSPTVHAHRGRFDYHSCTPILDVKDGKRNSEFILSMMDEMRSQRSKFLALVNDDVKMRKFMCSRLGQDCPIKSEKLMFIHSVYDMTNKDIADTMDAANGRIAYGTIIYSLDIFIPDKKEGSIPQLGCNWRKVDKKIYFNFQNDMSVEYVHDLNCYMRFFTTSVLRSSKGNIYHLEFQTNRNGVIIFKIVKNFLKKLPSSVMSHNLWNFSDTGYHMVKYYDYDATGYPMKPYIQFSVKYIKVSETTWDKVLKHAYSLTPIKFCVSSIYDYARSVNERVIVDGRDIVHKHGLPAEELYSLCNAVYLFAYVSRYNHSQIVKAVIEDETRSRESNIVSGFWNIMKMNFPNQRPIGSKKTIMDSFSARVKAWFAYQKLFSVSLVDSVKVMNISTFVAETVHCDIVNTTKIVSTSLNEDRYYVSEYKDEIREQMCIELAKTLAPVEEEIVDDNEQQLEWDDKDIVHDHVCNLEMDMINVNGDGKCMYHAFALGMGLDTDTVIKKIYSHCVGKQGTIYEECKRIIDNNEFGDEATIHVLAEVYGVSICVHADGHRTLFNGCRQQTIHLYLKDEHYQLLKPKFIGGQNNVKVLLSNFNPHLTDKLLDGIINMFGIHEYKYAVTFMSQFKSYDELLERIYDVLIKSNVRHIYDPFDQITKLKKHLNRSGYKLAEIVSKYGIDFKGKKILDLCSSPGGFSEYAVKLDCLSVFAVDLVPMQFVSDRVTFRQMNISDVSYDEKYDIIMCDGSLTNSYKSESLFLEQLTIAVKQMKSSSIVIIKHSNGERISQGAKDIMMSNFLRINVEKPLCSRSGNTEVYYICSGAGECFECPTISADTMIAGLETYVGCYLKKNDERKNIAELNEWYTRTIDCRCNHHTAVVTALAIIGETDKHDEICNLFHTNPQFTFNDVFLNAYLHYGKPIVPIMANVLTSTTYCKQLYDRVNIILNKKYSMSIKEHDKFIYDFYSGFSSHDNGKFIDIMNCYGEFVIKFCLFNREYYSGRKLIPSDEFVSTYPVIDIGKTLLKKIKFGKVKIDKTTTEGKIGRTYTTCGDKTYLGASVNILGKSLPISNSVFVKKDIVDDIDKKVFEMRKTNKSVDFDEYNPQRYVNNSLKRDNVRPTVLGGDIKNIKNIVSPTFDIVKHIIQFSELDISFDQTVVMFYNTQLPAKENAIINDVPEGDHHQFEKIDAELCRQRKNCLSCGLFTTYQSVNGGIVFVIPSTLTSIPGKLKEFIICANTVMGNNHIIHFKNIVEIFDISFEMCYGVFKTMNKDTNNHRYVVHVKDGRFLSMIKNLVEKIIDNEIKTRSKGKLPLVQVKGWERPSLQCFKPKYFPGMDTTTQLKNSAVEQIEYWRVNDGMLIKNLKDKYKTLPKMLTKADITNLQCSVEQYSLLNPDGTFLVKHPEAAEKYEYGYNGNALIEITSLGKSTCGSMILVSRETELMQSRKLYDNTKDIDVEGFSGVNFNIKNGVPGCGKTYINMREIRKPGNDGDLVLFPTREATFDFRKKINEQYGPFTDEQLKYHYRTVDSFIINYSGEKFNRVFVDEALMIHAGTLVIVAIMTDCKEMRLIGDELQIPFINRMPQVKLCYDKITKIIPPREILSKSYRCTLTTATILSPLYEAAYGTKIGMTTVNNVVNDMQYIEFTNYSSIPKLDNNVYLVFKQSEKSEMIKQGFKNVNTIHEFQGKQSENVILVRPSAKLHKIYEETPHCLVAISRHTKTFTYYSAAYDRIGRWITSYTTVTPDARKKHYTPMLKGGFVPVYSVKSNTNDQIHPNIEKLFIEFTGENSTLHKEYEEHYTYIPITCCLPNDNADVRILQEFYDYVLPGVSEIDLRYDPALVEFDTLNVHLENTQFNPGFMAAKTTQFDKLRPELRTSMGASRPRSFKESILAAIKRNQAVPDIAGLIDSDEMASDLFMSWLGYIDDVEAYRMLNSTDPIGPSKNDAMTWLISQGEGTIERVDVSNPIHEIQANKYQFSIKVNPKPSNTPDGQHTYAPLQTICAHPKEWNLTYSHMFQRMHERMELFMKKKFKIFSKVTNEEFCRHIEKSYLSYLLFDNFVEVDLSKFDKSQGYETLMFEVKIMRFHGVPEMLITIWINAHTVTIAVDMQNKIQFVIYFQRKSGDASTFIGNTLFTMAVLGLLFCMAAALFACFAGDDSLIVGVFPSCNYEDLCARLFNLESKIFTHFMYKYFCSKFLLNNVHGFYFLPDPVKLISKLGRHDLANYTHVEELRVSLVDLTEAYADYSIYEELSNAINDRYKVTGDHSAVFVNLYNLIRNKSQFHRLYYTKETDLICENAGKIAFNRM